jgi:hypothetical protein
LKTTPKPEKLSVKQWINWMKNMPFMQWNGSSLKKTLLQKL